MTQEQKTKFMDTVLRGIKDGVPVVAQVRAAIKERNLTATGPRIVISIGTMLAIAVLVFKLWTGAITPLDFLEALQRLVPAL